MDPKLEIVCNEGNCNSHSSGKQWLSITMDNLISKLRELTNSEKPNFDDDWDIPFERIKIFPNYYHRCGSQGDVFYGKLGHNPIAIKRVKDRSLTDIKHLRELNHTNIIKFRGISQDSTYSYIITEFCPYGTLHYHLHNGTQLTATILCNYAQQIANGMKYLHSKKILHRDLKPSNILMTHNDILKISDFGTHQLLEDNQCTYAGTHAYMAPEVIRSEQYSFPIDVWSYGVVLWEIIICDQPYKDLESSAVIWAVGNNFAKLPIPMNFPEVFAMILDGCWMTKPSERLTFPQICMVLKGAMTEIKKVSTQRWLILQAGWKREVKERLSALKNDRNESSISEERSRALNELERRLEERDRVNNDTYLRLQECSMYLQREREEIALLKKRLEEKERELDSLAKERKGDST